MTQSATGAGTQAIALLAMCPPKFFDVSYQINPWMDLKTWNEEREAWQAKAGEEYAALKATYERLGHKVIEIDPVDGQPDMVFMANCAAVLNGRALMAHFRHAERQGEEPHYQSFFSQLRDHGLISEMKYLPEGMAFEGCGDAVWDVYRRMFWLGHSKRTSKDAIPHVADYFGVDIAPMEMVSDRFYHLDVALAPLSRGHVVYLPEAFSAEGLRRIENTVSKDMRIIGNEEDADLFAVNLVNLGDDIVLSGASETLRTRLEDAGYTLHVVPTDAFRLAGGSVYCLTQRLNWTN